MISNKITAIPGPESKKWLEKSNVFEPKCMTQQAPLVWESAHGVQIKDVDGNSYIDWTSGVLVTNVGHSHPEHVNRICHQIEKLMNCYDFPTPERIELAENLVKITPSNLDKSFLLTTGSEATESAMRCAKRFTGNFEVISFYGAFHGRTYGAMSMGGKKGTKYQFGPLMSGVIFAPYGYCYRCPFNMEYPKCDYFCVSFIEKIIEAESCGSLAALIIEPYQGGAGFVFPPEGYLKRIEELCKAYNIIFILDEIQSSFGRTGKMFALEWEDLKPNLLCLGKGIGSGIPSAALMAESRILESLSAGEMSSTTGGNPISAAAALAVLDIMEEEKLVENSLKMGAYIKARLGKLKDELKIIGDVRGKGLVIGVEFVKDKTSKEPDAELTQKLVSECCTNGLMVGRVGYYGNVIRVAPPLVINEAEAEESCDLFEKSIRSLA
jgi:4-aminobutyrate aminotransferase